MSESEDLAAEILGEVRGLRDELRGVRAEFGTTRTEFCAGLTEVRNELRDVRDTLHVQTQAIVALDRGQRQLQDALVGAVGATQQSQNLTVDELRKVNARLDHVFTGPLGATVRDHESRITGREADVDALKRSR